MLAIMGKRSSKGSKPRRVATDPGEAHIHCPYCGTVNGDKSALSLMDQLSRSHAELCATLRLVGRQMLRFEKQADGSLEKVREVLKRADHIRKALQNPDGSPEALPNTGQEKLVRKAQKPAAAVGKSAPKRARSRSLHIISFPTN
jgi:hypothetical protein